MIRTISRGYRTMATAASALAISLMLAPAAHASGSSMPWEQPLQQILQSIEGPVAKIIAVIIIIVTGLTLAFGDTSGGFRRLIQIVFGLSIAFAASSFSCRSSRSAAGRSSDGGRPRTARRGAGIHGPGPSGADRAYPARRRSARHRHHERDAGRGRGPWPASLAGRPRHMGHRPFRGRVGGEARSPIRRGREAASAHPGFSGGVRARP